MAAASPPMSHGLICSASFMVPAMPMNSLSTSGLFLVFSWQITNSMLVVFIPSRSGVMSARSAALSSA